MAKITKYPRLRTKVYKGKGGQAYVYYVYDMRPDGKPDVRLGKDYAKAIEQWDQLHNQRPLTIGRIEEAFARFEEKILPAFESAETRKGYTKNLRALRPVFGQMAWDEVDLPTLRLYLDMRTAKTQGNREMSLLRIVWGKALLWGMTRLPWPAEGVRGWKNEEQARQFEVTPALFSAVYAQADQVLRDCMDIASATGMRLTDARTIRMPVDGVITHRASKTKKPVRFVVAESPVLSALVARREAMRAYCVMLLTTPTGRQVSPTMLRDRWDDARDRAALAAEKAGDREFGAQIRLMYLRDMRSMAADLAADLDEASKLLQHSSKSVTDKHYRNRAQTLRAVR
jgi:integrase